VSARPPDEDRYDVAIVGYGPVGALTALQLADAGHRVVVLERTEEPLVLPRAVGLDGESLRNFQRLGLAETVSGILQPPREPDVVSFTDSKHQPLLSTEIPKHGPNGWRDIAFFDQPELEALLREFVAERPLVDVHLGHEVTAIDASPRDVALRCRTSSGDRTLRAAYVVGCDGASSFVRQAVGIDWQSLGYDQDWLVLDIVMGEQADLPLATMQVCDPERLTSYICTKDPYRRWELQLLPGETREEMLRPERIRELLRSWLPPEHYEIRRAAVYQFHAATADRWRSGRVLLAGDAAHQTPPFLGQGLNAGFRDAVNLGWKLPLVLSGTCDAALLDSYAAERDAHARDLVEDAVAVGKLMETLACREAGKPDPYAAESRLHNRAPVEVPPLRGGMLVEAQIGPPPVGRLLRQPSVRVAGGATVRFDDLLGPGFALVGRTRADLEIGSEAREVLRRLGGRTASLEGVEIVEGELDRLFETHPAAIVRPDRYIFGVVDDDLHADALVAELGRRACLV
jgi:2-polyprenyl-6-methoxyphenol hydroxylase-like FAD-dependent oxidoreductase